MRKAGSMTLRDSITTVDSMCQRSVTAWDRGYDLVETDVYGAIDSLRRYDPTYFVVRNRATQRYEVHNVDNVGSTYCFTNPFGELDQRLVDKVIDTDIQRFGKKARMLALLEEERKAEEAQAKELKTAASNMAQETHYHFKEAFKLL